MMCAHALWTLGRAWSDATGCGAARAQLPGAWNRPGNWPRAASDGSRAQARGGLEGALWPAGSS